MFTQKRQTIWLCYACICVLCHWKRIKRLIKQREFNFSSSIFFHHHFQSMAFSLEGVIVMITFYGEYCLLWHNLKSLHRSCVYSFIFVHRQRNLLWQLNGAHSNNNQIEAIVHFTLILIVYFIS